MKTDPRNLIESSQINFCSTDPWLCWLCGGEYSGESDTAHRGAWGRLCWPCWMLGAESEDEEEREE